MKKQLRFALFTVIIGLMSLVGQGLAASKEAGYGKKVKAELSTGIVVQHPQQEVTGKDFIKVCLGKEGKAVDCDYRLAESGNTVRFPLKGSIKYSGAIVPADPGKGDKGSAEIFIMSSDGRCKKWLESDFWAYVSIQGDTLAWDVPEASFGDISSCFVSGRNIVLYMILYVDVKSASSPYPETVAAIITNDTNACTDASTLRIPDIKLFF